MVVIFREGELEYPDLGLEKPIKYTNKALTDCFKDTSNVPLTLEHTNEELCLLNHFNISDGAVNVDIPADIDYNNKGFSPTFVMDFIDCGEYYEPVNLSLKSIGLTDNPRTGLIYNSIKKEERSIDNMSDDKALQTALKRQRELETERASLENQLNSQKTALKKLKTLEKQVEELTSNNKELTSKIEEYTPKADKYDSYVANRKEELLEAISGGSEEIKNKFKEFTYDNLKTIAEQKIVSNPPKGVGANSSEGLNKVEPPHDDTYSFNDWKDDFLNAYGEEPTLTF